MRRLMRYRIGMQAPGASTHLTLEHRFVGTEAKARDIQHWHHSVIDNHQIGGE